MAMKTLEDTFVYKNLNKNNGVSTAVAGVLTKGTVLTRSYLDEAFIIIAKNFKYPLKTRVLEEFDRGNIVLMYSPPDVRLPTCMPFFLTKNSKDEVVAIVIVDLYGKMSHDGKGITIDAKKLYTIMEAAMLARTYYFHHLEINKRNIVITDGAAIYSNMFTRVLNKKYALNVDKSKLQKVLFLTSKFYMLNVLTMADTETTYNYAVKSVPNANPFALKELNDMVPTDVYRNLSEFIQFMAGHDELGLGLKDLQVRNYLESYINMYDASALLALEYFPYFLYNINSVTHGAYLNAQYVLEDIVDKQGAKIYADLLDFNR